MGLKEWWIAVELGKDHEDNGSWDTQIFTAPEEECIHVVEKAEYDKLKTQLDKAISLLNKIGIMGMGAQAYTKDFTTDVNGMVRKFLSEY
jgi:hypothetical protein